MSNALDTPLHDQLQHHDTPQLALDGEDFPFDDPKKEELYQLARNELLQAEDPRGKNNWWLLLIISAVAFVFVERANLGAVEIAILIGVLFFHELGHLLAMRWFGYTDLRMFFIPFFGAAAIGKKHAAPAWQQAWVALAGPLPGITIACVGYLIVRDDLPLGAWHVIIMLVGLNAFNLLPLGFLDGGRFFSIILFSRNAWVEATMQVVSAGLLAALAYWQHSIYLGILSLFMLLGTALVFRKGQMVTRLRQTGIQLPMTIPELLPLHIRMLFAATYDVLGGARADPKTLALYMREILHRVLVPAPGWLSTMGFLLVYLVAWILAVAAIALPLYDRHQLMQQFIEQNIKLVMPKQVALMTARQEAENANGNAKIKAQAMVKVRLTEYLEAKRKLKPLQEKLRRYDFLGRNNVIDMFEQPDEADVDQQK